MLVIRRRAGESILIADDIEIEVLETTPTRVKLGIKAPKEVTVLRKEVRLTAGSQPRRGSGDSPESADTLRIPAPV